MCVMISDGAVGDPRLRQARGRGGKGVQAQRAGDRELPMHAEQRTHSLARRPEKTAPRIYIYIYVYICISCFPDPSSLLTLPLLTFLPLCPPLFFCSVRRCSVRWIWRTRRPTCPALTSGAPRPAETTACHTCPAHYSTSSPKKR